MTPENDTLGGWVKSLSPEERSELEKHERLYREDAPETLILQPSDWQKFDDPATPEGQYVALLRRVGDVRGLKVLDAGCGDGYLGVILAKRGAEHVSGFDISPEAAAISGRRALANGVDSVCDFRAASVYSLPYADGSFDVVAGIAIVHHIRDKRRAAAELARVLKPQGRALFCEPLGDSELLERFRLLIPVASQAPGEPDHWKDQVKLSELDEFGDQFEVKYTVIGFFSRLDRVIKSPWFVSRVVRFDASLFKRVPSLRRFARSIVIELRRRY